MMSETADGTQSGEAVEWGEEMNGEPKAKVAPDAGEKDPSYGRGKGEANPHRLIARRSSLDCDKGLANLPGQIT